MINDKKTQAIADIYKAMLERSDEKTVVTGEDEDGNETSTTVDNPIKAKQAARRMKNKRIKNVQVATITQEAAMDGTKHLSGESLVNALTSACLSNWYDLTNKFNSRPEVYDIHNDSGANESFKVFKMTPGADVRETAFDAVLKSTNSIASALNKLFGKDVFEPRVSRTNGKLETLVAYSKTKGGVFQCKASDAGGHTEITLTMPEERELKRAFSSMTDTPHPDNMGELGFDDPEEVPVAGDPVPDYNPDYDVDGDVTDAELDDMETDPLGDENLGPELDDEEEMTMRPRRESVSEGNKGTRLVDIAAIMINMHDENLEPEEEELLAEISGALYLDLARLPFMAAEKVDYKYFKDSVNNWFKHEFNDDGTTRRKALKLLMDLDYPFYGENARRMWTSSNAGEGMMESTGVPINPPCNATIKNYETGKTVTLVIRDGVNKPRARSKGVFLVGPDSGLGNGISVSEFIDRAQGDTVRHANGQMSQILNVTHMPVNEKCGKKDDKVQHAKITNKRSNRVTNVVIDPKTGKQEVKKEGVQNPLDAAKKIAAVGNSIRNTQIHGKGKPSKDDEKRRKERDSLRRRVDEGTFEFLDKAGKVLGVISGNRKEAINKAKEKWGADRVLFWRGKTVEEEVSVGGSIAGGDSTANPEKTKDAVHARKKKKEIVRRKTAESTNEASEGTPYGFGTNFNDETLRKQAAANRARRRAARPAQSDAGSSGDRDLYDVTSLGGWRDLEFLIYDAFGQSYPDSDTHDRVIQMVKKKAWADLEDFELADMINDEAKKNGGKDLSDIIADLWDDANSDREDEFDNPFRPMEAYTPLRKNGLTGGPFG